MVELDKPLDLKKARILVTNDDGIEAPGIKLMERVALGLSDDVWIVAPDRDKTGAGHSVTIRTPIHAREVSPRHFAVEGTPTDCVLLGYKELLGEKKPDLILSGFNPGHNLAENITYSGTISAAIEGTLLGVRSIAWSLAKTKLGAQARTAVRWETAEHFAPDIIRKAVSIPWASHVLLNVNIPGAPIEKIKDIRVTRQGRSKFGEIIRKDTDPFGEDIYWILEAYRLTENVPGTDIEAMRDGAISVCPLSLNLTHEPMIEKLKECLIAG
ncbi:MAG: 5'/3'-nucleotidase SurE [Alphaproteobacteria bacterium]